MLIKFTLTPGVRVASKISESVHQAQTGNLLILLYQNLRQEKTLDEQLAGIILQTFSTDTNPFNKQLVEVVRKIKDLEHPVATIQQLCQKYLHDGSILESLNASLLPNMFTESQLVSIRTWYQQVIQKGKNYQDFDNRIGISWTDYRTHVGKNEITLLNQDPVRKFVSKAEQHPQSVFDYPEISKIFLGSLLPKYIEVVSEFDEIPEIVYWQTFFLRSDLDDIQDDSKHVSWHQDPSEYSAVADYTMVVMLDNPDDPQKGWNGGELLAKRGLPSAKGRSLRLTPKFNQAILFNNKSNSHAVTQVAPFSTHNTRDIIVINMYLTDPSL